MGLYLRCHNKLILIEIRKVYVALNGQDSDEICWNWMLKQKKTNNQNDSEFWDRLN